MQPRLISWIVLFTVYILSALPGGIAHSSADSEESDRHLALDAAPVISEIRIEVRDFSGNGTDLIEMARNLIFLRQGEQFSPPLLQESIEALRLSKRFREIHVDSKEDKAGITLVFTLTPFRLIKDIKVQGEYPLFEHEILKVMTVYVGDVFIPEDIPKQEMLIAEVFRREGFFAPTVTLVPQEDPHDGNVSLQVTIDKGPYLTLHRLEFKGNQAFLNVGLKSKMKIWRVSSLPGISGRFIERDLNADIENLVQYYRKESYPEAVIHFSLTTEPATNSASVLVTIEEGPRYEVEFTGNETFGDYVLKKDLVIFQEGSNHALGLKRSMKSIKMRYRMAGFLEAQVKLEDKLKTEEGETVRVLRFVINEGARSVVDSIQITGNHAFDDEKITKQMLTRAVGLGQKGIFVPETLEDDLNAIESLYRKNGYMDASVTQEIKWSDDKQSVAITLAIEEKVQTLVSSVKICGITVISEQEAYEVLALKRGAPFRAYMIQSDENALSALIAEKGYPHVTVKGEASISQDKASAQLIYRVDEGPYVELGQVYYTGNFRTRKEILQRELHLALGEPFSLVKIVESERSIRNLGIFDSVRFRTIGLKEKREKVHLLVDIEEKKPYFIQAGGGYETNRGFYLHARAGDRNFLGTNKEVWVAGETSQIGYRGELGITEPRLFGTNIVATYGLFSERREEFNQDFGTKSLGTTLRLSQRWFRQVSAGLNFQFEQREQFRRDSPDDATGFTDTEEFEARSILVTTPSISYDTRDSFIRPRKGVFSSFSVDISKGVRNSLDDFFKYRLDVRLYATPLPRLTFAWLGRAGYIDPFGAAERIPDDQLFYLGGTTDVRGFDENLLRFDANWGPVGGRSAAAGSVEARIDLGKNFELALFYDVGYVRDTYVASVPDEHRSSVGLGLRYITPIGPIGFLYGVKLDPIEGESPGRLHFSVGYTF
jgi:outer membrane protein insertion porin family